MNDYYSVVVSRTYKVTHAEAELRAKPNESIKETAKRLALVEMTEEFRTNMLEPGDSDFSIKVI